MLHGNYGHRRYSITHRAVQRLRELVNSLDDQDDEGLRDRLDVALGQAEDSGQATRTLDAMLGEPQVLVPLLDFGETLYAIIKEDTVVTVLPQGHGEEILQRGKALEDKVAGGESPSGPAEKDGEESLLSRREFVPRRSSWRREGSTSIPTATNGSAAGSISIASGEGSDLIITHRQPRSSLATYAQSTVSASESTNDTNSTEDESDSSLSTPALPLIRSRRLRLDPLPPPPPRPDEPLAGVLHDALENGRRQAFVAALRDLIDELDHRTGLAPMLESLQSMGLPSDLTIQDLISACQRLPKIQSETL